MNRIATLASTFVAGMIVSLSLPSLVGGAESPLDLSMSAKQLPESLRDGDQPELDHGLFRVKRPGVSNDVGYVWVREDTGGNLVETWALFRSGTTDGWLFPGANNTSVTITIDYVSGVTHDTKADFLQWAEDEYAPALNVDKDVDFEVHDHDVNVN